MALRKQDTLGKFTKDFSILITKQLQELAELEELRVKAIIRDKLEGTYKYQVRESYTPATINGQKIQEYNANHKHKKKLTYHHTGIFANSVKAVIDKNTVKVVIKDASYPDGATTAEVYEWLTKGTTKNPKKGSYPYLQGQNFSMYHSQSIHPFEAHTLNIMEGFLNSLATDIDQNGDKHYKRYKRKVK